MSCDRRDETRWPHTGTIRSSPSRRRRDTVCTESGFKVRIPCYGCDLDSLSNKLLIIRCSSAHLFPSIMLPQQSSFIHIGNSNIPHFEDLQYGQSDTNSKTKVPYPDLLDRQKQPTVAAIRNFGKKFLPHSKD